jgi:Mg2+/Co2+ transporter CorB
MSWELPADGPKTLNGLIVEYLEDIPQNNLSVRISGYPIEIIEVSDNMIKSVRVMPEFFYQSPSEEI